MKEFLEKTLRQNVIMTENKDLYKKLPLAYRGRYDIFTVETNGVLCLALHPKDDGRRNSFCNRWEAFKEQWEVADFLQKES